MLFPLKFRPKESYHERPRSFGSPRDSGHRKHAGCDLYAAVGTPVLAVADGRVLAVYSFYQGSWAVEVDHKSFVVRYGEVSKDIPPGIKAGQTVKRGQVVGRVGHLAHVTHSMLHFEMYSGKASGALTNRANKPFMRRSDLMDPTFYLDSALIEAGHVTNPTSASPLSGTMQNAFGVPIPFFSF